MVPVADRLERLHLILHGVTEPTDVPPTPIARFDVPHT
jgi:hypothetical protein